MGCSLNGEGLFSQGPRLVSLVEMLAVECYSLLLNGPDVAGSVLLTLQDILGNKTENIKKNYLPLHLNGNFSICT